MSERILFHGLAAQRLRTRAQWGGIILLTTVLMPYDVIGDVPQWIFGLLAELHPAAIAAAFAPTAAGITLLVARKTTKRASTLAFVVLATLLAMSLLVRIGADASAWETLKLPDTIARRTVPAILAMALAGAGANLSFQEHTRKASQVVLGVALVLILGFYLWPAHGESPAGAVVRLARAIPDLPGRFAVGMLFIVLFVLFPLFAVLGATVHALVPAKRDQSIAGLIAQLGLPLLLALLVYRGLITGSAGAGVLVTLATAAFLAAALMLVTASTELLVDEYVGKDDELELPKGLPRNRAAIVTFASAVVIVIVQAALARPPKKGVEWKLHAPTPNEEKLYSEGFPAWNRARRAWGEKLGEAGSAEEMVELKATNHAMKEMAKGLDPKLESAIAALADEGDELDVAGRKFDRLIMDVNDAARAASVPFYVDPSVQLAETKNGLLRTFRITTYRIEKVHPVKIDGAEFAALQVKTLGGYGGHGGLLGFSRDAQPFALVLLDEIDATVRDWQKSIDDGEPACVEGFFGLSSPALEHCGKLLETLGKNGDLKEALTTMTERHELQHQVDGPHLTTSPLVDRHMVGYAEDAIERTNRELSAYLAEMTSAAPPKLGLVHTLPFALLSSGGAEHHVAVILLSAMTGREVPRASDRHRDLDELEQAFEELSAMSDDELRKKAAETWKKAFGGTLAEVKSP